MINFGFLAQLVWMLDFLSKIIFNKSALGVTNYMFTTDFGFLVLAPLLIHSLSVNVGLIHTYKKKPTKKTLLYTAIYIIIIYALSLGLTDPARNVNCVHEICGLNQYTPDYYTILWPLIAFITLALPTQGIQYLLYKLHRKRIKSKALKTN